MGIIPNGAGALVGKRLGNYELVALLAVGGTAGIYLARSGGTAGFEKYVVVKCLHNNLADDREFVQMFLDEARIGALLGHSNIVQTLGLGEQDGRYYIVMEYVSGMSVALMSRRAIERAPGGRIPVPLVLGAMVQACAGLHYAHDSTSNQRPLNLIHRDVSPQNLVVTFEGVVKVVDFGIVKADERETATRTGLIKGKFAYMSPEQCQAQEVDRRTDVFALGVVLHEMLTGKRLFKRPTPYETYQAILACKVPPPSAVNHELDPALDPVVMKALAKHPSERYPSAEAFGEAMSHYLHSRGKAGGIGDIARFIEKYFAEEIEDNAARMRELLAGRASSPFGWDDSGELGAVSDAPLPPGDENRDSGGAPLDRVRRTLPEDNLRTTIGERDVAVDATRIELNPTAQLAALDSVVHRRRSTPGQVITPAATPPAAAAKVEIPLFGMATPGGSMFGGPPGGLKAAAPLPIIPAPARKPIPSIFGGPQPPVTVSVESPSAKVGGQKPPRPQIAQSAQPAGAPVRAAKPKGFASAPDAKTEAMIDGGFVAGAIAQIRAAEAAAKVAVPASASPDAEDADGPTQLDPAMFPPLPPIPLAPLRRPVPPSRPTASNQPLHGALPEEDDDHAPTEPQMLAVRPPTDQTATAPFPVATPGPVLAHTPGASAGSSTAAVSPSVMMLPVHVVALPPIDTYIPYTNPPARRLTSWILLVVVLAVLAVLAGVIVSITKGGVKPSPAQRSDAGL